MLLPDNTDVVPTVTQATPAVMKNGYQYGIPYTQPLGKKKTKPGKNVYNKNIFIINILINYRVISQKI